MMNYEGSGCAQMQAATIKPMPELARIKQAAERLSLAAVKVENFNARFHGALNPETFDCDKPVVDTYRNDICAIFTQIERLEAAVSVLDSIG